MGDDMLTKIKSLQAPAVSPPSQNPSKSTTQSQKGTQGRGKKRRGHKHDTYHIHRKSFFTDDEEEHMIPTFFPVEEDHSEWQVVTTAKVNDVHFVTKYRSRSTGMELVHATVQGPTVHCYITLATKADDDDGLANILRSLIYMGSEEYPYAEALHTLTTRCMASGDKSHTDVDHTCYEMTTAGGEGILSLLPIFLDHIYFPLLTEASYLTEVCHITSEGEDSGPLYKHVLKETNLAEVKIVQALQRAIYDSTSSYQYQHLGLPDNIRNNVDIHKVRDYHKKYYVPMNTCITICGQIDPVHIFDTLDSCLKKLIARGKTQSPTVEYEDEWTKPWLSEKLVESDHSLNFPLTYPSQNEEYGILTVAFVGPQVLYSTEQVVAMRLIMEYLVWGKSSPLQDAFLSAQSPLAGNVKFIELCHMKSIFAFQFEKVKIPDMSEVIPILKEVLIAQLEEFDEQRMLDVINYCYQREVSTLEAKPHATISTAIARDFCYGTSDDGLLFDRRVNNSYTIQQFIHQPRSFWIKVLTKGVINPPWIVVDCLPSKDDLEKIAEEDYIRKMERLARPEELQAMGHRLEKAFKRKKIQAPQEVLDKVKSPSLRMMGFHNIVHLKNPDWSEDFKCNLLIDDIQSSFVYVTIVMDTSSLDAEQKKYLVLFIQAILKSPIYDEYEKRQLPHQEFSPTLESDVLKLNMYLGISQDGSNDPNETPFSCGAHAHNMCFTMQLQIPKVEEGFQWIRKLLWNTRWDIDVLKKIVDDMIDDVDDMRKDGRKMIVAMLNDFLFRYDSNVKSSSCVRQQTLFKNISENLSKDPDEVLILLESIRRVILQPRNMTVHIATNVNKLEFQLQIVPQEKLVIYKLLRRTFKNFYLDNEEEDDDEHVEKKISTILDSIYMKNFACIKKWAQELILRMRNKDPFSYLIQATPCVKSFMDPEFPLVLLTCHYFVQRGGPLYKEIVAPGFAKEVVLKATPNTGMIFFMMDECPDVVQAYNIVYDMILSHLNEGHKPPVAWDTVLLEGARSSIIFRLIAYENTPKNLAMQSLHNNFRNLTVEFSRNLIDAIVRVTLDEVKMITRKYLRELFVENTSCAVAAPAEKVPAIIKEFTNYAGKRFCLMSEIDQSFLSRW